MYAAMRFMQGMKLPDLLLLACYLSVFVPLLLRYSFSFLKWSKNRRFQVSLLLYGLFFGFYHFASFFMNGSNIEVFWNGMVIRLVYCGVFFLAWISCIYFMELALERVRLQQELKDVSLKYRGEMTRLQQFIDQAPLVVMIFDSGGHVTHLNEEALRLIAPMSLKDILYQHYVRLQQLFGFNPPSPIERIFQGEERVVEMMHFGAKSCYTVTSVIKGWGNQIDGVLFTCQDVTELQQLKDEVGRMERLSLVGQMAASITHEIRNPMAVIRGFIQLLNERSPTEQQSYFHLVLEELDRANSIINDFLSLAQNRIVERESCDLNEVLGELTPLLWADANMRGQTIDMRLSPHMERLLLNDKEIKQLVLNLARNGMEAMNDKGALRIETVNDENSVQLRVVDQGVGIPKEQLERLFEPFYTTKTNGTGLGLALCLSIVERHNAKIEVESKVGEGTAFIVTFCKPGRKCW
ncbi:sensor histidine kinase [Cohnella pontilimi]|uniref:histidine kinase n=2 Tax=Cohnella pontilimi TaxID=2564100 RepID=A0A4U0FDY6_9BACL|nr:sensor histidine kinase [Cohnella pontilimi]